ncbi:MAG: phosphoglucosamine mutase, partial [Desulfurococcaceae archaeon]
MRKLFGTDGVRGIVGKELTPLFIARLALAIGSYFGEGSRILVGMDYRGGNEAIKKIVEGSLVFSGLKVYD